MLHKAFCGRSKSVIEIRKEAQNLSQITASKRRKFLEVFRGWFFWHNIVKKYNLKKVNRKTAVILFPLCEDDASFYALLYLDRMLSLRGLDKAIIITTHDYIENAAKLMSHNIMAAEIVNREKIVQLMQYYNLMAFDPRFFAISLNEPSGRNGRDLIGVCDITTEEMVAIGIYRIIPFVQKKRPEYTGSDVNINRMITSAERYEGKFTQRIIQ